MVRVPKYLIFFAVFVILAILFIWGQSLLSFDNSVKESQFLLIYVKPYYDAIFGYGALNGYTWRKVAHIIEYFMLGLLTWLFALLLSKLLWNKTKFIKYVVFSVISTEALCLFVAIVDELIQMTNDRHPQIIDIGYDMLGANYAIILCLIIMLIIVGVIKLVKSNKNYGKRR